MPSVLLGRAACPECGFDAAHVKQSEGEGKRPYRYCPECAAQYFTRTDRQARDLIARTRKTPAAAAPSSTAPSAAPAPAGGGLLSGLFN